MHRVLLLGAGKIGRMIARFLTGCGDFDVLVGDADLDALARLNHQTRVDTRKICKVVSAGTKLDMAMSLPRWSPRSADAAMQANWERYLAALRSHHERHFEIGREFERDFREKLSKMTARDCKKLERAIRDTHDGVIGRYRQQEREMDTESGYGRIEGVEIK